MGTDRVSYSTRQGVHDVWAKSITLMAKSVRGAMAYMNKSRIFVVAEG